jgi:hypothetical protein
MTEPQTVTDDLTDAMTQMTRSDRDSLTNRDEPR